MINWCAGRGHHKPDRGQGAPKHQASGRSLVCTKKAFLGTRAEVVTPDLKRTRTPSEIVDFAASYHHRTAPEARNRAILRTSEHLGILVFSVVTMTFSVERRARTALRSKPGFFPFRKKQFGRDEGFLLCF